ncbi:MAG TPA: ABC transporter ATP-binding protein, partial [Candidatus Olsenella pullistercoris]|nr:ABC transporter ATP-binding protein [Candidatus Olsenella pullistercoris]
MNNVLEVRHFRKSYRDKVAVRDLSLSVAPGEICGFIGHNGAGKTTLIRSVVGAQPPTSGTVSVCGIDVWREPVAAKRRMAYVPDNPDVYDFLTGVQYLDLIADVFGVGTEER